MKKMFKYGLINFMVFITIAFTFELLGQLSFRTFTGIWVWQRFEQQIDFFEESPYTAVKIKKDISTESQHFNTKISSNQFGNRITSFEKEDKNLPKVFCFGGSTTFGYGLADSASWPFILQNRYQDQLEIENYGILGFSTLESLIQSFESFPLHKPILAIYYLGWNDIKFYFDSLYIQNHGTHGLLLRHYLVNTKMRFSYYFFTPFILEKIKKIFIKPPSEEAIYMPFNDPIIDSLYSKRLKMIKAVCESQNVKVVFVSQVINEHLLKSTEETYDFWTPSIKNKDLPRLMKGFNRIMAESVIEDKNCLIIDSLMIDYQWNKDDFLDYGHFSYQGSNKFIDIISPQIETFITP